MPGHDSRRFPDDFVFGTAAASFQIEGSPLAQGAAESNWYRFTHTPGKIENGDTADIACDHYHRYEEDLDHLKDLGVNSYRLSFSWPRIEPEPGNISAEGISFYDRIIDGLLERGIDPLVTLFHWDEPAWLTDRGGFTRRWSVERYEKYAETVYRHFGDRVKRWITINEPMVYSTYGYLTGIFPPGKKLAFRSFFRVTHHLLMAHARGVEIGRAIIPDGEFGISNLQIRTYPDRPENGHDIDAAKRMDALVNRLYCDPIFHGTYPPELRSAVSLFLPRGWQRDLEAMHPRIDFFGLNYYFGQQYRYNPFVPLVRAKDVPNLKAPRSAMWEIYPDGLFDLLGRLRDEYGNPRILITENGYPLPEDDGPVTEDDERIAYLHKHLRQVLKAREAGVRCDGYYLWSFLDNFEWSSGNRMRFGLIRVDFETLERTWKKSAHWYAGLIRSRVLKAPINPL